jgi:hypothetical protein
VVLRVFGSAEGRMGGKGCQGEEGRSGEAGAHDEANYLAASPTNARSVSVGPSIASPRAG